MFDHSVVYNIETHTYKPQIHLSMFGENFQHLMLNLSVHTNLSVYIYPLFLYISYCFIYI